MTNFSQALEQMEIENYLVLEQTLFFMIYSLRHIMTYYLLYLIFAISYIMKMIAIMNLFLYFYKYS